MVLRLLPTIFWIAALYFGICAALPAQTITRLTDQNDQLKPQAGLEYLEDPRGDLSFRQITEENQPWKKHGTRVLGLGVTESVYWLRMKIKDDSGPEERWNFFFEYPNIFNINFYLSRPQGGYRVIRTGSARPYDFREVKHRYYGFRTPPDWKKTGRTHMVYIRIESGGVLNLPAVFQTERVWLKDVKLDRLLLGLFYGIMLIMIIYIFITYLSMRDVAVLYFLMQLIFTALAFAYRHGFMLEFLPLQLPPESFLYATYIGYFFATRFFRQILKTKKNAPRIDLISALTEVYCLIGFIVLLFSPHWGARIVLFLLIISPTLAGIFSIYLWRLGVQAASYFLLGWGVVIFTAVMANLVNVFNLYLYYNEDFMTYSVPFSIVMMLVLLSLGVGKKIDVMRQEQEEARETALRMQLKYTINLEKKVDERTHELQETLEQVQALKIKQDADYFLTSQLITPLIKNQVESEQVQINFYVRQFKQFSFQKWNAELGGDLNAADTIYLSGQSHTVFINADAMGKSMQGAGGALVLGAVFRSLMEQSFDTGQSPGFWLKETFRQLDRVFQSFDGFMLISLILGIIEDVTGNLYFINAEHPRPVLFREDVPEFVGVFEEIQPKLGSGMHTSGLPINELKLHPGEMLICGSDGRDDILTGTDAEGSRMINSDESQFLEFVREAQGELPEIVTLLMQKGELRDDISLLRILYRGS